MALANRAFPSLTTERLRLRAPHVDDAAAYGAVLSIPGVTHSSDIPDAPTMAVVERMIRFMSKLYESRKECAWIIDDATSGWKAPASH